MNELIMVAAVCGVAWVFWYGFLKLMQTSAVGDRIDSGYHPMLISAVRWLVILFAAIAVMRVLGFSAGQVLASLSAFAVVAAVAFFAYWSVLSNALCSLLLYLFQPFRVGDWIEMRENENNIVAAGKVAGIDLIYVTLVYNDENDVEVEFHIPTNLMFQRTIRVVKGEDTKSLGQHYAEHHGKRAEAVSEAVSKAEG